MNFCLLERNTTIAKGPVRIGDVAVLGGELGVRCVSELCFPLRPRDVNRQPWPIPVKGFANDTWIEVSRYLHDPKNMGFWMYISNDSGVWFNVGRTIAFPNHAAAMRFFLPKQVGEKHQERKFIVEAYRKGYDSIQFTRFLEYGYMKYEIVFTRLNSPGTPDSDKCMIYEHRFRNLVSCKWKPRSKCNVTQAHRGWT